MSSVNGRAPPLLAAGAEAQKVFVGTGERDVRPSKRSPNNAQVWSLRHAHTPIAFVAPGNRWSGMHRVAWGRA